MYDRKRSIECNKNQRIVNRLSRLTERRYYPAQREKKTQRNGPVNQQCSSSSKSGSNSIRDQSNHRVVHCIPNPRDAQDPANRCRWQPHDVGQKVELKKSLDRQRQTTAQIAGTEQKARSQRKSLRPLSAWIRFADDKLLVCSVQHSINSIKGNTGCERQRMVPISNHAGSISDNSPTARRALQPIPSVVASIPFGREKAL